MPELNPLESLELTDKRAERLERLRTRAERITVKLQLLEPLMDKVTISYEDDRVEVDVYDSPFDDTYERGERLDLTVKPQ